MVAGGIALLKQAFPNHTPEQITDRILASANNDWFTPAGNTTFTSHGNSITHGYHNKWGHGIPDFYAALSPITTNSNPASIPTSNNLSGLSQQAGSNNNSNSNPSKYNIASTSLKSSASFGDSISKALSNETGYFYDALSAGFKFNMSKLVKEEVSIQKPPCLLYTSPSPRD